MKATRLEARAPFHLEATVRVLQRRPTNRVDVYEEGRYRRVLPTSRGPVLVGVESSGAVDAPEIRYRIDSGASTRAARASIERTLTDMLGLADDPDALCGIGRVEAALAPAVTALRGMRIPRFADLFETFVNVVPFQQVSLEAGIAIVGRLVERFGPRVEHEGRVYRGFPRSAVIADASVAAIKESGLSTKKAEALNRLARGIELGEIRASDLAASSTDEALRLLTALPGIGPWSASLVMLRGFGRADVFPPGDSGAQRGLRALLRLPPDVAPERFVERFGDRRGYVYFCVLGTSLLAKGLIRAAGE